MRTSLHQHFCPGRVTEKQRCEKLPMHYIQPMVERSYIRLQDIGRGGCLFFFQTAAENMIFHYRLKTIPSLVWCLGIAPVRFVEVSTERQKCLWITTGLLLWQQMKRSVWRALGGSCPFSTTKPQHKSKEQRCSNSTLLHPYLSVAFCLHFYFSWHFAAYRRLSPLLKQLSYMLLMRWLT